MHPKAVEAVAGLLTGPANASSPHRSGKNARDLLDNFRKRCAACLEVAPREILFTSGGTESNNLALQGSLKWLKRTRRWLYRDGYPHTLVSCIEHSSVEKTFGMIEEAGYRAAKLPVGSGGVLDMGAARAQLDARTALVSAMLGNNEFGAIQPIAELAEAAREAQRECIVHTDAVQCVGKIPVRPGELGVDLLSLSAHKFGGPPGVGLLWIGSRVGVDALFGGGKQQGGIRPGTENIPGIAGMTVALEEAVGSLAESAAGIAALRDELQAGILALDVGAVINAPDAPRLPHVLSVTFPSMRAETLMMLLDREGIRVSPGSACSTGNPNPSPALLALGLTEEQARCTLRFSFGAGNDSAQVEKTLEVLARIVRKPAGSRIR